MRLTEGQIKQAILHEDQDVREAAVYYFARSYSSDPGIMPLAIQAIEQYGWENAFHIYSFLDDLVQNDETVLWLIRQIKKQAKANRNDEGGGEGGYVDSIRSALVHADAEILKRHQPEILELAQLDDDAREAISERIWFLSRSPEELWHDLFDTCRPYDEEDEEAFTDELDFAERIVKALARHPDYSAPQVLAILAGETDQTGGWLELFVIDLAGDLRLKPAVPHLITILKNQDDWSHEECYHALSKIGGDSVVRQLADEWQNGDLDLKLSAASILENIHSDLSVRTCLNLLVSEIDVQFQCSLIHSVLTNFSDEGIEPARQLILTTPLDLDVLEVRSELLTACKLMEKTFPEFDAWQEDAKNDVAFRRRWYEEYPLPLDDWDEDSDDEWDQEFSEDDDDEDFEDENDIDYDLPDEPVPPPTIVRQQERIGRNDRCPCGSGKKYKNCCLRNRKTGPETDVENAAAICGAAQKKAQYPIGTVAFYGPDDKVTIKIVAAVIRKAEAEPILERWVGTNLRHSPKVQRQIQEFFDGHGVKSVAVTDRNLGCPHEEGEDFPLGEDCPFCPFWAGKQGSNRRD
jgi:hypothetical protein